VAERVRMRVVRVRGVGQNHYRSGVKLANWVEEEYGDYLLAQEGGRPVANTSSVCQTSFVAPPPDAHLTHRGVRSDATGTAVPLVRAPPRPCLASAALPLRGGNRPRVAWAAPRPGRRCDGA
jgi:hypothetical protein